MQPLPQKATEDGMSGLPRASSITSTATGSSSGISDPDFEYLKGVAHSNVKFDVSEFMKEFTYHTLMPLAVPFMFLIEGWYGVRNRQFFNVTTSCITSYFQWFLVLLMWFLYIEHPMPNISLEEVVVATGLWALRSMVISIKYAYQTEEQRQQRKKEIVPRHVFVRQLLIAGWLVPDLEVVETELHMAILRQNVDISSSHFVFEVDRNDTDKQRKTLFEVLNKDNRLDLNMCGAGTQCAKRLSVGMVDLQTMAGEFILDSVEMSSEFMRKPFGKFYMYGIPLILSLIQLSIPPLAREYYRLKPFGEGWAEHTVFACWVFLSFFNFGMIVIFMLVGIMDYKRRSFLMSQLSAMLSKRYRGFRLHYSRHLPVLDMQFNGASNLMNWLSCRNLLKDFGRQYFLRIQLYISAFGAVVTITLVLLIFERLFSRDDLNDGGPVLVIYFVTVIIGCLLSMISTAKRLNTQHVEHLNILVHIRLEIQKLFMDVSGGCAASMETDMGKDKWLREQEKERENNTAEREREREEEEEEEGENGEVKPTGRDLTVHEEHINSERERHARKQNLRRTLAAADSVAQVIAAQDTRSPVRVLGFLASDNFSRALFTVFAAGISLVGSKISTNRG